MQLAPATTDVMQVGRCDGIRPIIQAVRPPPSLRLPFAALAAAGLALSHELVYLLSHGHGEGYARAMSEGGHDRYWISFVLTSMTVCLALTAVTMTQLHRLSRKADGLAPAPSVEESPRYLAALLARIWPRLAALTAALYLAQENIERAISGSPPPGLGAMAGEHAIALPIIAVATLLIAAVGALACWRRDVLAARIMASRPALPRVVRISRPPAGRRAVSFDAGRRPGVRAPPEALTAV